MPRVKQERIVFEDDAFDSVYHVDSDGVFHVRLPEAVRAVLGWEQVHAETLEKCQQAFKDALKRYRESVTKVLRVILYDVKATAHIMDDSGERCLYSERGVSFCNGAAVSIAAQVFDEHETKSADGTLIYRYVKVEGCDL
jgi:hypothetical protein